MEYTLNKEEIDIVRDMLPLAKSLCSGLPAGKRIDKLSDFIMNCGDVAEIDKEMKDEIILVFAIQELAFRKKYNVLTKNYGIMLSSERLTAIARAITAYGSYDESKRLAKAELIKKLKAKDKIPSRKLYISDMHFFHEKLNQGMDKRGFATLEEMHSYMIRKWNEQVTVKDEVYILGDFSVAKGEDTNSILAQLSGRKYLIRGNHDRYLEDKSFKQEYFEWVKPYAEIRDNNRKVVLSHYPVFCYHGQYKRSGDKPTTYMLYGHVHDTHDEILVNKFIMETRRTQVMSKYDTEPKFIPCQMINCFCMFSDYTPISLDEWIEKDNERRMCIRQND